MRFRRERMTIGLLLVAAVAGCKQYDSPTTQSSPADAARATSTTSGATGSPAPDSRSASASAEAGGASLGVAGSSRNGRHLVDASGRTLYVLQADDDGASGCSDACTTKWPPLLAVQGVAKALDPSIKASAITNFQRPDGDVQLAYQGRPLYRYAQDARTGQMGGQGVKDQFGEWYLLAPDGRPIEGH